MIPCECTDTICICETTISSPDWRCTATDLPTECNNEGHHVHANICQCKLKQINEIIDKWGKSNWPWGLHPEDCETMFIDMMKIKELSE